MFIRDKHVNSLLKERYCCVERTAKERFDRLVNKPDSEEYVVPHVAGEDNVQTSVTHFKSLKPGEWVKTSVSTYFYISRLN